MSITGGVDSRVSLAASPDAREAIHYFTYQRPDISRDATDVAAASSMASAFRLRHSILRIDPAGATAPLTAVLMEATFLSHGRPIVEAYRSTFPRDTIHIRSNIGEVGRCHYHRTSVGASVTTSPADITARELAAMWAHRRVAGPVVDAFEDWKTASRFRHIRGFDARDLFYWEHRMSCWHSNVVLESDFAFDTHVLFNSRWILERLLAAPFADRCRGTSFAALVTILWPELLAWPMAVPGCSGHRATVRS
jgi:hypothetical protein